MQDINIKFRAYIPNSLGKSLLSYFKSDWRFNPENILNYDAFKRNLENADRLGFTWLPEPGNLISNYYFGTDNINFHNSESIHNSRLEINLSLPVAKIGRFSVFDQDAIFKHKPCGNSNQHSDKSHRIQAYICPVPLNYSGVTPDLLSTKIKYIGVCGKTQHQTSNEKPLKMRIQNKVTGTHFSQPGKKIKENTTIIEVSASADYPFLKRFAPDIDFKIIVKMYRIGGSVEISVTGEHNKFPAYELIMNNSLRYNYDPSKHGYKGPTPYNLGIGTTEFHATKWISLSEWEVNSIENASQSNRYF